ncbi:hypothetical protein [Marmoricola sp. URHB0036]|uniref:hypothetical protein n=1 Tax=Marmoricola sp. URHB0036 TaxID=1298863 RepID=UPI0012DCCAD3|nr:hypothetical protein [Marmoricola sp. URHB0036]
MPRPSRLAVAEARRFLETEEFPFLIQLVCAGEAGSVEISVSPGDGERARRYFAAKPVDVEGVHVTILVEEADIIPM